MCVSYKYHDVEDNSQAPDVVGRAVVRDALQDLWRCVRSTTAVGTTQLVRLLRTRKSEVGQFHVVVNIQKDVLAFQVPSQTQTH